MTTREKIGKGRLPCVAGRTGYTLFEILLALGIVAVLLGVTVPMLVISFGDSESERVIQTIEKTVLEAHQSAEEKGEIRRLQILETGLSAKAGTSTDLPKGWKIQVKRFNENRFRKPEKFEIWEFNSSGICDALELRVIHGDESIVLKFDPLTSQILPDDE